MKVQVTSRHFRAQIDYLLGTRDRQLSLNVMVNGVPDRLGKGALDERMGQASQDGTGKPRSRLVWRFTSLKLSIFQEVRNRER